MSTNLLNQAVQQVEDEIHEEDKSNQNLIISVRPSVKNDAMLRVFVKLTQRKASVLLANGISEELYKYVTGNKAYAKAIAHTCKKCLEEDNGYLGYGADQDCLGRLIKEKILTVHYDSFDL